MSGRNTGLIGIGHSVRLKSGGPEMSVVGTMPRDTSAFPYLLDCMCCWDNEGTVQYATFPDACLEHVHHYLEFGDRPETEYTIDGDEDTEGVRFYGSAGGVYLSDSSIDVLNPNPDDLLWDTRGVFWRVEKDSLKGSLAVRLRASQRDAVYAMLNRKHMAILLWNFNKIGVALQTDDFQGVQVGGGINMQMDAMSIGCTFTCKNVRTYVVEKEVKDV